MTKKRDFKKIVKKVLIAALVVTLYSNIGWVVGNYYRYNVLTVKPQDLTTLGRVAAGGWAFSSNHTFFLRDGLNIWLCANIAYGAAWPLGLFLVVVSWLVYGLYYVGDGIVYAVYYAGWFIFAGGGAKLLGLVSH